MRILCLCHGFNALSQRLFVELRARGHDVSVELDVNDAVVREAVALFEPDLILAPFLKRAIPEDIWRARPCLIVHPGPKGDRGPAALDWAILSGAEEWGVTVLQAAAEMDAGPVWAHRVFPMRAATKSSLYRNEVTEAALAAVLEAIDKIERGESPETLEALAPIKPAPTQAERAIDWAADDVETALRKIRASDGAPGLRDRLFGEEVFLFDARRAEGLSGAPGDVVARSGPAIAVATRDGAVWIGHVRRARDGAIKLPATHVFADRIAGLPERDGYEDIWLEEADGVGYLHFPFLNGAMGTEACERLLAAWSAALTRPTKVIVLTGGPDFWSNGLDLNRIEAADSAADESWRNINAIDDLAEAVIRCEDRLVVSAVCGNAGAGGAFLARAADAVWLRRGSVLNPHYKDMGNLYGSELWTYLLPRCAGEANARRITQARLPMGAEEALELGLADAIVDGAPDVFMAEIRRRAAALAASPDLDERLREKRARRARDEAEKPLSRYREEELARMRRNFYGFDPSYHVARYNFVHKVPKSRTPLTIATHRRAGAGAQPQRKAS